MILDRELACSWLVAIRYFTEEVVKWGRDVRVGGTGRLGEAWDLGGLGQQNARDSNLALVSYLTNIPSLTHDCDGSLYHKQ